ncbi:hypothetical protein C4568_00660 [Candidatus Parcubacteria bacterium]|nr:MAG: hypothetical protein C4568_00660 [Candidatus Parcubacteria bacterium]
MLNFNGGTTISGTSIATLGLFVGSMLLRSGDVVIAICFLVLTTAYVLLMLATLCRYVVNYRRNMRLTPPNSTG